MASSAEKAILIRPAAPDDKQHIQALVRGLSPRTRYLRFFNGVRELSPHWLEHFTRAEPGSEVTLLALKADPVNPAPVGMAQYVADPFPLRGDFAVVVDDAWQGAGIGSRLIQNLVCVAREAGIERIEGEVLAENRPMLRLVRGMGFEVRRVPESALYLRVSKPLAEARRDCAPLSQLEPKPRSSAQPRYAQPDSAPRSRSTGLGGCD